MTELADRARHTQDPAEMRRLLQPDPHGGVFDNVLRGLAENPHAPPEVMADVAKLATNPETDVAICKHHNTPVATLQSLAGKIFNDQVHAAAVAALTNRAVNATTNQELVDLTKLVSSMHIDLLDVQIAVAGNRNASPELLTKLAHGNRTNETELALTTNPSTP